MKQLLRYLREPHATVQEHTIELVGRSDSHLGVEYEQLVEVLRDFTVICKEPRYATEA